MTLKNQPVIQLNLQWVLAGIGNQDTSHVSGDSRRTPERMTSSSWRPYFLILNILISLLIVLNNYDEQIN
jgi:hypothetical protein